ncbi:MULTISPECIES: MoaD/ThiS family protein [unclassified Microbacterium]|uniref:MoaD/ThiS family protein n=1 Tax=unclassified Microbacterium TaxID=2609290 RepID=UPI000CFC378C|nr:MULTISPECIES: MoaD/ThiS family protein [unclassified Microbacterium]PQZ55353.1 molybdopterin synthase sulfur carrier subunit [Microbacterium sp. MYb43]PQZ73946.1 molybdopterin synthase sulfur carrier subunit [Microbacterium sp. MYb40]PRB21133.1 molybdopterin synthase sulfur carrier subunit [Microbacterium sp. MYb54]PRB26315.1 molybdopterin synthase sulfur carrier subunit [Microbacterium sp. MYb50]PRB66954.1 molybdopterin synthase sulfur carrier subunit [Microbacterium sp. MYb24]
MTRVRYFAAAAEAAGTDSEERGETSLVALRAEIVAEHPALAEILPRCAVLVDGVRTDGDLALDDAELIDILPPFAGG